MFVIALTQVQDLPFFIVEFHEVGTGPPLKPVQVPLDGILFLQHVDCSTPLGVFGKSAEVALNHTVTYKDVRTALVPALSPGEQHLMLVCN